MEIILAIITVTTFVTLFIYQYVKFKKYGK
jgi:hypothetical protein